MDTQICRRRLASLLQLKQSLSSSSSGNAEAVESLQSIVDAMPPPETWKCFSSARCCALCTESREQLACLKNEIVTVVRRQRRKEAKASAVSDSALTKKSTASPASPATPNISNSNNGRKTDATATAEATKAAVLNEVRELILSLKSEAINVGQAVHRSDTALEQRQAALAAQVNDTLKANKKASDTEQLMGMNAGVIGEALIRVCSKVAPRPIVDAFIRPLVASLFQLLWIAAVVLVTISTVYLMITAPKPLRRIA